MTDRSIDAEIEANERRGQQTKNDGHHSIVDDVENAFDRIVKPLADDVPSEADREERREENDADQR